MAGPAKVIIQLQADSSGLTPGIEALQELNQVDKSTADQFKAANKAFQDRGKVLDKSVTSTEKFAQATKKLVESIAGGAINQATENIKKYSKEIENTSSDFKELNNTVSLVKKQLSTLDPGSSGFSKLEQELQAAEIAMGNFTKQATSSRGQLKQYREALTQLEEGGFEGTQVFNDLAVAAGQLEDQVGDTQARIKALASDTFKFDAAIQAVQGVAGAFSVAQGAAALFGSENEQVQQALLKVNAAMAILQGLQQIQNILQKQSAVSLATEIALKRVAVLQTNLQAAAESRFTIIRVAATAAQSTLNAVMAANPATVLLVAIGALAAGLLYLTSRTDGETAAQAALKKQLELTNQSIKNQQEIVESLSDADDRELALKKARGLEGSKLAREEIKVIEGQIKRNADLIRSTIGVVGSEEAYSKAVADNNKLRSDLRIKEAELSTTLIKENTEAAKKAAEEEKKVLDAFLRDQVAANEVAVEQAKTAFSKFEAEVQAITARLRQALANKDLGQNERVLAEINAGKAIIEARKEWIGEISKLDTANTAAYKKNLNDLVLASAAANQARLEGEQRSAQERLKIADEEKVQKEQLLLFAFQAASQIAGSLLEVTRNANDAELQSLQERLDKGLISQKQYDLQVRAIKRRQAQQDKQLALFQAVVDGAAAINKAFRDGGLPLSILVGLLVAAQVAAIASKPIPAFKKGTKNAPKGPALVGEAGPELLYTKGRLEYAHKPMVVDLERGDKVIPALDTARILSNWRIPVPSVSIPGTNASQPQQIGIDYDRIGASLGKHLKKLPINVNNFNEDGFSTYQAKQYELKQYTKNRYSKPK